MNTRTVKVRLDDGSVETRTVETAYCDQADFWSFGKEAYAACFNGFDEGVRVGRGATEAEAITELVEQVEGLEFAAKLTLL